MRAAGYPQAAQTFFWMWYERLPHLTPLVRYLNAEQPDAPFSAMPMTISWLGNSSVATLPTLLDLLLKGKLEGHQLTSGQTVVFASVGAGTNTNALVYRIP